MRIASEQPMRKREAKKRYDLHATVMRVKCVLVASGVMLAVWKRDACVL